MKLAISREKEINDISDFLKECSWLSDEFKRSDFEDMDWEEFEIFKKYDTKDIEGFLSDLVRHAKSLFWEKAIFNLQTLLENCADKTLDHLDFNAEIKQALNKTDVSGSFLFDKSMLDKAIIKQPYYAMGVDTYDKNALAYCLSRKVDGVVEILLCNTMRDEAEFKQDVENLAKYFNADVFRSGE